MTKEILLNQVRTPDGTILKCFFDAVEHVDTVTGETYRIDGSWEKLIRSKNKVPAEELTVYKDAPFEVQRVSAYWGNHGKDGKQPLQWKPLNEMSNKHIFNILRSQKNMDKHYRKLFTAELQYREQNNIEIPD